MKSKNTIIIKTAVSILAAVLLVVLYVIIFSFSNQDAETSGSISHFVSEKCVEMINAFSGGQWTEAFREEMAAYFENPIRKLAHFGEYACMGILVYTMLRQWLWRGRRLYFITVFWTFVSAAADEIHQLFIPGRCGCFADVCLDTLGAVFGIFVCVLLEKIAGGAGKRRIRRAHK